MNAIQNKLGRGILCAGLASGAALWANVAAADVPLTDPAKTAGWAVSINGQVDAYLSWVFGHTLPTSGGGKSLDPTDPNSSNRNTLVNPQNLLTGNPTPVGATQDPINDTKLSAPRVRSGFASTILGFTVLNQITDRTKVTFKFNLWAGIQNGLNGGFRSQNDVAPVDWRDQYVELDGPLGLLWGGRRIGLFNRGGMRMDYYLVHKHGVGNPCNVDSNGTAACGNTGVGSMFPNRNAQIGYGTPLVGGLRLEVAIFDPSMIDSVWDRTPAPRFEAEATFHHDYGGTDELNFWANGLEQPIGRVQEIKPTEAMAATPTMAATPAEAGIPADATRVVWGAGLGGWGRVHGFALGGTAWTGAGLGTATAFGTTAIDEHGTLRKHFGYMAAVNYRLGNFELGGSYGSSNVVETDWDKISPRHFSVIKSVNGIALNIGYHFGPVVFSIDGMNMRYLWHRGETLSANVISAGLMAAF